MRNILLLLEYDGTRYAGWQRQKDRITVQGVLEATLTTILNHPVTVLSSGRTDAGVHALGQVATFMTERPLDCATLHRALIALLPKDIRVIRVAEVPLGFHPRKSAQRKQYVYAFWCGSCPVFLRTYVYPVPQDINWNLVREGAKLFVGCHDFTSFSSSSLRSSVRTVFSLQVCVQSASLVLLWIEASGFLHHMVRMIFGELLLLGEGRRSLRELEAMLQHPSRTAYRRFNLPPHGLYLVRVEYDGVDPYEGFVLEDVGFVVPVWTKKNTLESAFPC
ncbi:tRNA pseudouridine(38-40) synthase TruA [Candidatus Caldatribacterium sp.]|uniref:tRNA pseudouridine(38-40) synthase TruA n=1 Tax=Candidatus Caldatribacterium sp. TaxID=2282143 RepID=UPI0029909147|nr:tRNA pseudouridine(38-40) synthase TruA [Candidatus Caldatribacterium sp.]MDW8082061.1 tRNA pseudouridine(38-40) synthase TruA [Candidatus Calescibacterium sp.]